MAKYITLRSFAVVALTAGVISAGTGAAMASPARGTDPVSITFDAMEYSAASHTYFPQFVKTFEAQHPNVKVNLRIINWSQGLQVLDTEIGAGKAPNVAIIGTRWLPGFEQAGVLEPVTKAIPKSFFSRFYPGSLKALTYKGTYYSLPEAASVRLLVFNKALFKKAGIAAPPTTWSQLAADAVKVHKATGAAGYGLTGSQVETSLGYWYTMWGFGGAIFNKAGTKGELTSPQDIAALTFLQHLIKAGGTEKGVTASSRTDLETEFDSGKVAMMIDGPWLPNGAIKAKIPVGLANMPHQPGVKMRNTAIEDSWVIFSGGSAAQKKAAAEFSEFMFTTPVRTSFDEAEGFLPVEKAVGALPYFAHNPVMSVYLRAFAGSTVAEPIVPKFSTVSLAVTNAVEAVYAGATSPSAALATANSKVDTALGS